MQAGLTKLDLFGFRGRLSDGKYDALVGVIGFSP